jgi:hypothetical protein
MSTRIRQYKHRLDMERSAKERARFMKERAATIRHHKKDLSRLHALLGETQDILAMEDYRQQTLVCENARVSRQMETRLEDLAETRDQLLEDASALANTLKAVNIVRRYNQEGFEQQKAALQGQYSTLEESLIFADAEHRIHMQFCKRDRGEIGRRMQEARSGLDVEWIAREALQAEYDALRERHAVVNDDYMNAAESLKSLEHKLESKKARHHEALDTFCTRSQAYDVLVTSIRKEASGMRARLSLVSEGYALVEKKLHNVERERYKLLGQHRLALAAYRAAELVSEGFTDTLEWQNVGRSENSNSNCIPYYPIRGVY